MREQRMFRRSGLRAAVLAGLLVTTTLASGSARADLVWATEGTYPPWNLTESDGSLNGFDIDLVKAICRKLDTDCSFKTAVWPAMMDELAAGDYDAIISGIAITPEREATIAFTRPYMGYAASFAAARGSALAQAGARSRSVDETLALLKTARIGVQFGTVNSAFIEAVLPDAFLVGFDNQQSLNAAVASGVVEAGFAGTATWTDPQPAKSTDLFTLGPPVTSMEYPVLGQGLAVGIAQGNDDLKASLDAVICTLADDGTIQGLTTVWFGQNLAIPCND